MEISVPIVIALGFIALVAVQASGDPTTTYYSFIGASGGWQVSTQIASKDFVAMAKYQENMNTTGWATFDLSTNSGIDDVTQAYGAGYLEGFITAPVIWNWWENVLACDGPTPDPVNAFLVKNEAWMRSQIAGCAHAGTCDYWNQVNLLLTQLDGLTDGYNNATTADKRLSRLQLLGRNAFDEWDDIMTAISKKMGPTDPQSSMLKEHCSVMVKVTDDLQNLFTSHVTWGHFCHALRIFKHYTFNFGTLPNVVSFSSFPAALYSGDDYYITSNGLVITETTNDVFDVQLFENVTIMTVPFWIRVSVASRVAKSGSEWVQTFAKYNSGTYNNQWQIVDMKLFTPGTPLQPGVLWIAEQIPGYVISEDATPQLIKNGYFPSYNIPYFEFVYNVSGYPAQFAKYGNAYSYEQCPRANIFRRDQSKVKTLDDYKNIMRYNDYKNDPLSLGDACNGISARCDLNTADSGFSSIAFGGYDCKVTDNLLIKNMTTLALSGPTSLTLPPFTWAQWQSVPHLGQPLSFDFPFVAMTPTN